MHHIFLQARATVTLCDKINHIPSKNQSLKTFEDCFDDSVHASYWLKFKRNGYDLCVFSEALPASLII